MNALQTLKGRATSPVNKFWRKMQLAGAIVGGVGLLITTIPISLPAGIIAAGSYLMTVGATLTGVAQLTEK